MKKVLIISTSLNEQKAIEEVAKHHNPGGLSVETTASFGQDAAWWIVNAPSVLIINIPEDSLLQGYFFTKLRKDVPTTQPLILLCSQISAPLMQLSTTFSKVRMVKTPAQEFFLYRTLIDLVKEYEPERQQLQPRYLTNHPIEITSDFAKGKVVADMKNLSLSGAYFESNSTVFPMKPGDFVKISVLLGQSARQYLFDAKVVWSRPQPTDGLMGYGVAFTDRESVYNNLLKNL